MLIPETEKKTYEHINDTIPIKPFTLWFIRFVLTVKSPESPVILQLSPALSQCPNWRRALNRKVRSGSEKREPQYPVGDQDVHHLVG